MKSANTTLRSSMLRSTRMLMVLVLVAAASVLVGPGQDALGGTLEAWGRNGFGECNVPPGKDFVAIAAGRSFGLALKADGSLAAWGYNGFGQTNVPAGNDFAAIAAGYGHSLALKSDGSLAAWGSNHVGQCDVPAGNDFVAIAGGESHSLALKSDGSLEAWGDNFHGQTEVPAGTDFVAIACGSDHGLALKSDGSLAAWGWNNFGQTNVPVDNDFVAIAAGGYHGLALKSDGSLAAWGLNDHGQCDVPAGNFVAIAAGGRHNLALKADGSLSAWGSNNYGQCDVPAGNFVAIAAGTDHNLAITAMPMGTAFTYQGRLIDSNSVADGLYDFQFKLFNAIGRGMQKGSTIDINDLDVIDGYFTVELDFNSPGAFNGAARWLEIGVRVGDFNDPCEYTILEPRVELTPIPYAIYAGYAETAGSVPGGITGSGTANYIAKFTGRNTLGDSVIYESAGNVGIGTASPDEKLTVEGTIKASAADKAVYGEATDALNVINYGGYFVAAGRKAQAVYGYASNNAEDRNYGGYFHAAGDSGRGVFGSAPTFGGYFTANGSIGMGVYGEATNAGNVTNYGGYFHADGHSGRGVYGEAAGSSGIGVYGKNTTSGNYGYLGSSGYGVWGEASGVYGRGVCGYAPGTNAYAGYFQGRGYFSGNVGIGTEPIEKLTVQGVLSLDEIAAPSASSGYGKIYAKSTDSKLYFKDDEGKEYDLTAGGGDFVAGDFLICANDTQRTTLVTSWRKLKETKIGRGGTLRIKFGLRAYNAIVSVHAQIWRNNAPVGTICTTNSTTNVTYSEDISGWSKGDLVQVWGYTSDPSDPLYVRNLRLYADNPAEAGAHLSY